MAQYDDQQEYTDEERADDVMSAAQRQVAQQPRQASPLDGIQPRRYFDQYEQPGAQPSVQPVRRYTPAGPSATSYNPNAYAPAQSRRQEGVVRTGPTFNYTERTGITAGPMETWRRGAGGAVYRNGVMVQPPRIRAQQPQTLQQPQQPQRSAAGDFAAAAQQPGEQQPQVNPIQAAQDKGAAMRRQAADQERQNAVTADGYKADAISTLLNEWRKNGRVEAIPRSAPIGGNPDANGNFRLAGYGPATPRKGDPTRRIAMLEPTAVRELNSMRKQLGLRDTDKIVGMIAVGDGKADAQTGKPSFIIRYRDADGRVRSEGMSYTQAARFVLNARKAGGNANAEYDMANDEMWGDPLRYKGTSGYLETKGKLDAADLKNQQTRQQIEQGRATFEQQQADRAEAKTNEPVTKAQASAKEFRKLAVDLAKSNPELAAQMMQVAAKFEDDAKREQGNIDRRKEIDGLKKGDAIQSIPGARKKNDTGYDIEPMPGFEFKNGKFVPVKPQKPGAPKSAPTSSAPTQQPVAQANPVEQAPASVTNQQSPTQSTGKGMAMEEMQRRYTDVFDDVRKQAEEAAKRSVEGGKKVQGNKGIKYDDAYREIFTRLAKKKIESLSPQELERLEKVDARNIASPRINLRQSIFDLYGVDIYDKTGLVGGLTGNGGTSNRLFYEDIVDKGVRKKGSWRRGGNSSSDYETAISVGGSRKKNKQ